jgi:hypothetical protein
MDILKLLVLLLVNATALTGFGQSKTKCNCPPIKLYVYDSKIDFPLDQNADAVEAGKYLEAENSGDWLLAGYFKQHSDDFMLYKGLRPGATKVTTYELPPADGGSSEDGIDFTSYVEVHRSVDVDGTYSYTAEVKIYNTYTRTRINPIGVTGFHDLGKLDDKIDDEIKSLSPIIDKLREDQEEVRDNSNYTKWIGLKFKVTAEKTRLKVGETTKVHIKVFDCADSLAVVGQRLNLRVGSPEVGVINAPNIITNNSGEATVNFTAVSLGETHIFPDFTYTGVNGHSGYHVLDCGDLQEIKVTGDDRNYFYLGSSLIPGTLYEVKEPLLSSFRVTQDRADYVNGQWNILVNGMRKMKNDSVMQPMSMAISITQSDTGTYQWTVHGNSNTGLTPPFNTVSVVGTDQSSVGFVYVSWDCVPHPPLPKNVEECKLVPLDGSTTITVFDKKKKIIKGYFSGVLMSPKYDYVHVSGAFSVHMNLMP